MHTTPTHHWMPEQLWTWHARSGDYDGAFCMAEVTVRAGSEPPMHVHSREDEVLYVLDGELTYMRGLERIDVAGGDFLFLPRGVPHGFAVGTPEARVLVLMTPGGMDDVFVAHSEPAAREELPPEGALARSPEGQEAFVADVSAHGIQFVGPPVGALIGAPAAPEVAAS